MKPVLLTDFGSTYTKVTAVDLNSETVLGTAQAHTTVDTDIGVGLEDALARLEQKTGRLEFSARYACSSAAGGLRMAVSGLMPELTSEAARLASLGAGAKVIRTYSFELTEEDLKEIEDLRPDIFLLVGGIDGGNSACILHNAKMLSAIEPSFPVIVAGNRSAAAECKRLLQNWEVYVCENVMPKFGALNIVPAQSVIREIFLRNIIKAKGLSGAAAGFTDVLMPTPAAVLRAVELLSGGFEDEKGLGELIAVDVGGATTDVYSVAAGTPRQANTVFKGLPEPYAKRTVEGDIGMRYSAMGIVDAVGIHRLCQLSGLAEERLRTRLEQLKPAAVPEDDAELAALDYALACSAVETAVSRHAGSMEEAYTMMGLTYVQSGKDLRDVRQIIVTGGSLIHTKRTEEIARHACFDPMQPTSLRPVKAEVRVDRTYILAAMGLLSAHAPAAALHMMKKELEHHGYPE